MERHRSVLVAGAAALVSLLAPVSAQAASKSVSMGEPPAAAKQFGDKYSSDVDAFFPSKITIHAGDSVKFVPANFHNVEFPAKGKKPAPLLGPAGTTAGAVDAAGAPFWFNGQSQLGFSAAAAATGLGKTFTYTGAKDVQSGLPLAAKPKPMTVKFPKAGTYTYYCMLHPGMKGRVKVVAKGKPVPSAKADAAAVKKQVAAGLKVAKGFDTKSAPAGTIHLGLVGKGGVEFFGFAPSTLAVRVGTSVTFEMPTGSLELHTATTGPGNPESEPTSYLGKIAASFTTPLFDSTAIYPSDPPPGPSTVSATSHGNGFWNSGGLDSDRSTTAPQKSTVTFTQAGTYQFYCLVHPFMHGTVTVS